MSALSVVCFTLLAAATLFNTGAILWFHRDQFGGAGRHHSPTRAGRPRARVGVGGRGR